MQLIRDKGVYFAVYTVETSIMTPLSEYSKFYLFSFLLVTTAYQVTLKTHGSKSPPSTTRKEERVPIILSCLTICFLLDNMIIFSFQRFCYLWIPLESNFFLVSASLNFWFSTWRVSKRVTVQISPSLRPSICFIRCLCCFKKVTFLKGMYCPHLFQTWPSWHPYVGNWKKLQWKDGITVLVFALLPVMCSVPSWLRNIRNLNNRQKFLSKRKNYESY